MAADIAILALFNLSGGEIILILALILVLFGGKKLPALARGLGDGISEFRKGVDRDSHDAGKSVTGIYGKPAAQALTPDNQTAELYDPAVFQDEERTHGPRKPVRFLSFSRLWQLIRSFVFRRSGHKV